MTTENNNFVNTSSQLVAILIEAGYKPVDFGVMDGSRLPWSNDLGVTMGSWLELAGFKKEAISLTPRRTWVGDDMVLVARGKEVFTNGAVTVSHVNDSEFVDIW